MNVLSDCRYDGDDDRPPFRIAPHDATTTTAQHATRLREAAMPMLEVGRFSEGEVAGSGLISGIGVGLGLGGNSASAVRVSLRDLQSLALDELRASRLLEEISASRVDRMSRPPVRRSDRLQDGASRDFPNSLTPMMLLRSLMLADSRNGTELSQHFCRGDFDRLNQEGSRIVVANRILYAGGITFDYMTQTTAALRAVVDVAGQLASLPSIPAAARSGGSTSGTGGSGSSGGTASGGAGASSGSSGGVSSGTSSGGTSGGTASGAAGASSGSSGGASSGTSSGGTSGGTTGAGTNAATGRTGSGNSTSGSTTPAAPTPESVQSRIMTSVANVVTMDSTAPGRVSGRFVSGSYGTLGLERTFNRPAAVGMGAALHFSIGDAAIPAHQSQIADTLALCRAVYGEAGRPLLDRLELNLRWATYLANRNSGRGADPSDIIGGGGRSRLPAFGPSYDTRVRL